MQSPKIPLVAVRYSYMEGCPKVKIVLGDLS
jgi:hypothetical protein